MTAGHVVYEFTYDPNNATFIKLDSGAPTVINESVAGLRNYISALNSAISGWNYAQVSFTDPCTNSSIMVDPNPEGVTAARQSDTLFIEKSGDVDDDDAGLILFLDENDLASNKYGLSTSGDSAKVFWDGLRTSPNDVALSKDSSTGFLKSSSRAAQGDSGAGIIVKFNDDFLDLGNRKFVIGNIHSISGTLTCLHQNGSHYIEGDMRGNYFRTGEFVAIMNHMQTTHSGNVTESEPTNLIVGSESSDTTIASYRADIFLGGDGDDNVQGEQFSSPAWGNDQLFGGAGSDNLSGSRGSDLIHGGDHREYSSSPRLSIDQDGEDKTDYTDFNGGAGIKIFIGDTAKD